MLLDTTPTPAPVRPDEPVIRLTTVESPVAQSPPPTRRASAPLWVFGIAAVALGWAFFPTLDWLVGKWSNDPSYSHGFLVPFAAAFIVYRRRPAEGGWFSTPQPLFAVGVFVATLALRALAGGLLFHQLDALALLISVAAVVIGVGGWRLAKNCWPGLVFLIFLVPLPYEWEQNLGGPLKVIATVSSTYLLQAIGLPAVNTGNLIYIDDMPPLGVEDACNGLKMLLTFAAIGAGAVFLVRRTWFEKFVISLSVIPIAVVSNVLRITATGLIYYFGVRDKETQHAVHDGLGYAMAVVGIAFLLLQLWVLDRLVIRPNAADEAKQPLVMTRT
ncbi:MAG: exosortase/archaeosortase family protein [Fimbriiglobus sp.]|nr:exosortase/archaeosortase family protein [Fimbriiglobus sp.]